LRDRLVERHTPIGDSNVAEVAGNDDRKAIWREPLGSRSTLGLPQQARNHRRWNAEIANLDVLHLVFGQLRPNDVKGSSKLHLFAITKHPSEWAEHGRAAEILQSNRGADLESIADDCGLDAVGRLGQLLRERLKHVRCNVAAGQIAEDLPRWFAQTVEHLARSLRTLRREWLPYGTSRDARRRVTCHPVPPSIVGDPRDERDTGEEGEAPKPSETSHAHCQFLSGDDESIRYRDPTVVSSLSMRSIDVITTSSANDTVFAARARSRNASRVAARGFTLARVR